MPETPPGLHKCKKSPFSEASWAEFHKGPLCGAYPPPAHTHSQTHTPPPSAMPTQEHRQWGGVSGQQSHIHVNLKHSPSLEQKCCPDFAAETLFVCDLHKNG